MSHQVNPPPKLDISGGTEIEHEEETSVQLQVGPDIQPGFYVEREENNWSIVPRDRDMQLFINQAQEVMEPITKLSQLNERTDFACVVAKIIRIWSCRKISESGVTYKYSFVLLDCEGTSTTIEGMIRYRQYWHFAKYFVEGAIWEFWRFKVVKCPPSDHTVSCNFILIVTGKTTIRLVSDFLLQIPVDSFKFVSFENIGTEITDATKVVDIIGRLIAVGPVRTIHNMERRVHFQTLHLLNERNFPLQIIIWEQVFQVSPVATLVELLKEGPVVLALNSLRLNLHNRRGKTILEINKTTRFYFDMRLPVIADFFRMSNLQRLIYPAMVDMLQPQTMQNVGPSSEMKSSLPSRVTIAELLGYDGRYNKDKQFQCIAEIVAFNNPHSWFYNGCFNCQKQVLKDDKSVRVPQLRRLA